MIIDNDTDEPVDYDVDNGGGGGNLRTLDATATSEPGPPAFVCPMQPKFRLGPRNANPPRNKVDLDLSQSTQSHRLIFLITPAGGQQTMLIVPSVPPGTSNVKIETDGSGYYRAVLS